MNDSIPALNSYIEPSPVHFTFGAPAWYVVGALIVLLLLVSIILTIRHYYKNRYRRVAIKLLQQKKANAKNQQQYVDTIYTTNVVMKQICIKLYTREVCANLREKEWLNFLNQTSHRELFQDGDEKLLAALYLTDYTLKEEDVTAFVGKATQWIKKHRHAAKLGK